MNLRSLMFKVGFDGSTSVIKKMDGATSKLGKVAESTVKKLKGMEKSFVKTGKSMATKITAPIVGLGVAGTKMALDLDNSIRKVTTLANRDILPVSKIQSEIRAISDASGIAQTEIAESVYGALSAGVDSANVMAFVRSGINLTRAGFTDMETAIDATTTVLNAYGDNAFEISKIHDIFVQTQDKGKISVDELGKSIGRVIPTASSLGVNLDQLGTGYAILTAKGQNAQLATTNLNAMLGELGSTGSTVDKAIRQVSGKSFAQLTAEGKNVGEVLGLVDEYARKNNLSLKDMFGSMNAGSAAVTLLSDGVEGFNSMLTEMDGATGKTAENAATMEDGWYKIQRATTQAKNALIDLGATMAPTIEWGAEKVSELVSGFNELDSGTKQGIAVLLGLATAIGPVIWGLGKVAGMLSIGITVGAKVVGGIGTVIGVAGKVVFAFKAVAGGAATVAEGMALIMSPIGWVVTGLIGLVATGKFAIGAFRRGYEETGTIMGGIVNIFTEAVDGIKNMWNGLRDFLKNPIKGTVQLAGKAWNKITGKNKVDGSHRTGLSRVPYDGYCIAA